MLLQLPELTSNYRIVVARSGTLDEAEIEIEVGDSSCERREVTSSPTSSITFTSCGAGPRVASARASVARSPSL